MSDDMPQQYSRQSLQAALAYRRHAALPGFRWVTVGMIGFTLTYIICSIWGAPEGKPPQYHFVSERGTITAMSAVLLAMAGTFSLAVLTVNICDCVREEPPKEALPFWPWVLLALGFVSLSLDEVAQFHERLGFVIAEHASSGIFRNWNDVIVILYGVVAIIFLFLLLPHLLRYRFLLEFFAIAFLFYVIHTLIDSTQRPKTTTIILEESAKLFCSAFLTLGTFCAFLGCLCKESKGQHC